MQTMNTIEAIKQVRDVLGIGLTEAKLLIEQFGTSEKAIEAWHIQQEEKRQEEEAREFVDPKHWANDWYWESQPIDEEDLEILKMLSNNYCKHLWAAFVTEQADHLMRPDVEKHWKIRNNQFVTRRSLEAGTINDFNWEADSDKNQLRGLGAFLDPHLNWNPKDVVYLLFGRYSGFQLNWELFLKYADPLLLHAYGVVLVNATNLKVVIFEEHGYIQIGERI